MGTPAVAPAAERLEEECKAPEKVETFRILKCFLGDNSGRTQVTVRGERIPLVSAFRFSRPSYVHRLRRRHRELAREEVESPVLDPAEVDAELHGLCEALVHAEERVPR